MALNVELLEQSFELVKPKADELVASFYRNLFTDYPESKPLFSHSDMGKQQQMLKGALVMVVQNLRNPKALSKALKGLGARHVKYGAMPEHYPLVGNSLLKSLGEYAGGAWTPELKEAWTEAYGAIAELMLEGADYSKEAIALESVPSVAPTGTVEQETVEQETVKQETVEQETVKEEGLKVELLEQSFELVKPKADEFAASFYGNLFTDYPASKPLFEHSDMGKQQQMLKGALVMVVENLRKPDVLTKSLKGLGARHVKYGAMPEHYPLVGNSLIKTLGQYAGNAWTPELKEAWVGAYGAISELMLDGADYSKQEIQLETPSVVADLPATAERGEASAPSASSVSEVPVPITYPSATTAIETPEGIDNKTAAGIIGGSSAALIVLLLIFL